MEKIKNWWLWEFLKSGIFIMFLLFFGFFAIIAYVSEKKNNEKYDKAVLHMEMTQPNDTINK